MAQALVDKLKYLKTTSTQTNDKELEIQLSHSKIIKVYYSKAFKEYVVSFNLGNSKKFVISRSKWLYLRKYLNQIDKIIVEQ
jgi:hypothetical protein